MPQNELFSAASQRSERGQHIHRQQLQRPQSQLIQAQHEPQQQIQYKTYAQVQAPVQAPIQVPVQAPVHAPIQQQSDVTQVQYKDYTQAQVPNEAQPDLDQVQYKIYQQAPVPVEPQPDLNQISYKQYPEAPAHAKPFDAENFKPQHTYEEPTPTLYGSNYGQQFDQQPANADSSQYEQPSVSYQGEQKSRRDYSNRGLQGRIIYKNDQPPQQQLPHVLRVPMYTENIPTPPAPKLIFSKNMPPALQQLLLAQAHLPYLGLNSIPISKPKLFVPAPLPDDGKREQGYRPKIYYLVNGQYQSLSDSKPVHEEQRR